MTEMTDERALDFIRTYFAPYAARGEKDLVVEHIAARLRAAPQPPSEAQSGEWVLVPREPTPEMLEKGGVWNTEMDTPPEHEVLHCIWRDMLAAAPQPPAEAPGWYCAHCQRGVDSSEVTYSEQHQACGRYIANDDPPPAEAQAVGELIEDGAETEDGTHFLHQFVGPHRLPEGTKIYAHPPPSAPVGVEGLPAKWRAEADEIAANNWACNSNSIRARADELENALAQQPAAVSEVTRQLIERDRKGREKYGVTLDRRDLSVSDWLQHMSEELMDAAGYALAAKRESEHPAAAFRNDGNSEAEFIADDAIACTACGGSGHRDDQQPAAVDVALRVVGRVVRHLSPEHPEGKSVIWNDMPAPGATLYVRAAQQGGES